MKLIKWGWRNVCSYGNKYKEIILGDKPKLILITGDNGHGKTTMGNALEFASYGKSSRRSIKDLPNWINGGAETYVNFKTDDGRNVEVSRGIKPDSFDLRIDGVYLKKDKGDTGQTKENVFSKPKLDAMIENELINIPFDIFTNNIILSIKDFKSFIKLKAEDKRKITDKIFDTAILNSMYALLKADAKAANEELVPVNAGIDSKKIIITQYEEQLKQFSTDLITEIGNKETEILDMLAQNNASDEIEQGQRIAINLDIVRLENQITIAKTTIKEDFDGRALTVTTLSNTDKTAAETEYRNEIIIIESNHAQSVLDINNEVAPAVDIIKTEAISFNTVLKEKYDKDSLDVYNGYNKNIADLDAAYLVNNQALQLKYTNENLEDTQKYEDELLGYTTKRTELDSKLQIENTNKTNYINLIAAINAKLTGLDHVLLIHEQNKCDQCHSDLTTIDNKHLKENIIKDKEKVAFDLEIATEDQARCNVRIDLINADIAKLVLEKGDLIAKYNEKGTIRTAQLNKEVADLLSVYTTNKQNLALDLANKTNALDIVYNKAVSDRNAADLILLNEINAKYLVKFNELVLSSESNKTTAITVYNEKISNIEKKLYTDLADLQTLYTAALTSAIEANNESLNQKNIELSIVSNKITAIDIKRTELTAELQTLRDSLGNNKIIESLNNAIDLTNKDLDILLDTQKEISDRIWKCTNTQIMFADDGLKRMLMRQVLPVFNESIANLTREFEFKYQFSFTEDFEPVITYMGQEISADAVSAGEEAIMDIIVVLSTLRLIILKHPTMNILFLDEIFSSLSIANIAKAIGILRNYIDAYGLNIFVISHTPVPIGKFDNIIDVKFENYFSDFTIS